jgi:hypothetical protein
MEKTAALSATMVESELLPSAADKPHNARKMVKPPTAIIQLPSRAFIVNPSAEK